MEPLTAEDPRRVGRYRLVARLGAGGMGRVFLGFSPAGRPMAVKVVYPKLARDPAFVNRFRQEVAAARRVSGAGIPAGTPLAFNLIYNNGMALIKQEVTALAAAAKQAGIAITLVPSSIASIITTDDNPVAPENESKRAMEDFGSYTQVVYPTTITVFNTPGAYNIGSYSDPQADRLINASVTSANPDAVKAEAGLPHRATARLVPAEPGRGGRLEEIAVGPAGLVRQPDAVLPDP
jgi:serine/threonine protein kinase